MKFRFPAIIILSLAGFGVIALAIAAPQWLGTGLNWGLVTFVLAAVVVVLFIAGFENRQINTREIALISIMGSIGAIIRIPFAPVPNAQPATFLIICTGYVFGPAAGFMTGTITALVSNMFLGHGPWTLFQVLAWGLAGASAGLAKNLRLNIWVLAVFGLAWGYLFGVIMNVWFWASLIYPLTWQTFVISQLNSIWFDTIHALANALFMLILGKRTIAILQAWRRRFLWKEVTR